MVGAHCVLDKGTDSIVDWENLIGLGLGLGDGHRVRVRVRVSYIVIYKAITKNRYTWSILTQKQEYSQIK